MDPLALEEKTLSPDLKVSQTDPCITTRSDPQLLHHLIEKDGIMATLESCKETKEFGASALLRYEKLKSPARIWITIEYDSTKRREVLEQ